MPLFHIMGVPPPGVMKMSVSRICELCELSGMSDMYRQIAHLFDANDIKQVQPKRGNSRKMGIP